MTNKPKNEYIDPKAMGADFCWSFGDGDAEACKLPREIVRDLFSSLGFNPALIDELDVSEAMKRAMGIAHRGKNIVIKELKSPHKDTPKAFGIYQVQGVQGESGDNIVCGARVRVHGARNQPVICLPPEGRDEIPECMKVGDDMVRIVTELTSNVLNRDLSQAILAVGGKLGWISRRKNKGGVYYLHRTDAERFATLLKGIQGMTAHMPRDAQFIPHITEQYDRPLTIDSWSGAALDHYEAKVGQLVKDLDRVFAEGNMREKTLLMRADECDDILKEANKYAMFLKGSLQPLEARLKKIRSTFQKAVAEGSEAIEKDLKAIEAMVGVYQPKAKEAKSLKAEAAPTEGKKKGKKTKLAEEDFDLTFGK